MSTLVTRSIDAMYAVAALTHAAQCGAEKTRVFWNEHSSLVPDQSGDMVQQTDRFFRYRAWTFTAMGQNSVVTLTFPSPRPNGKATTAQYVVRNIFPLNDGLEKLARVAPVTA